MRTRGAARLGVGVKRRITHLAVAALLLLIAPVFGCKPADKPANGNGKLSPEVKLRPVYEKGIKVTKEVEGFRQKLYTDAARNCSIGYGHKIKKGGCDGDEPAEFRRGITETKASTLLTDDMEVARRSVMTVTSVKLSDGQYAALCDFTYNIGSSNFKGSTLLKL